MGPKAVLIGERVNTGGSTPSSAWQRIYDEPQRYWDIMTQCEAFRWHYRFAHAEHICWRRIRSIIGDLPIDHSLNLLKPSAIVGAWSTAEAGLAARALMRSCPRPVLLLACGRRVAKPLSKLLDGQPYPDRLGEAVGGAGVWLIRLPHPSGRCRVWNEQDQIDAARERFAEHYERISREVSTRDRSCA